MCLKRATFSAKVGLGKDRCLPIVCKPSGTKLVANYSTFFQKLRGDCS